MDLFFRELGSGKPIIILHGLFGSSDNWLSLAKVLSYQNHIYLPDLRNHGNSFHQNEFNYKVMVNDLLEFIQHNNILNPIIIGHSLGGKIGMNLALTTDLKIDKLIIVDIGPQYYPVHHEHIIEGLRQIELNNVVSRKAVDSELSAYIPDNVVRQFLLKNLKRNEDGSYVWKINLDSIAKNIEKVGEAIKSSSHFDNPTLFVKGEKSNYLTSNQQALIARNFPNYQMIEIPNAGHWVHAEQPEIFLKIIQSFINA